MLVTGFFLNSIEKGVNKLVKDEGFNTQIFKKNKIGIMGGTFNPIHFGHLFIAQTALDALELNKIIFIPTGIPPHKQQELILDSNHRINMINLATKSNPNFSVSDIEVKREATSYTIDTIRELKQLYSKETEFYFITGTDAFVEIETWKEYEELLRIVKFVVVTRQVSSSNLLDEKIDFLTKKYRARITKIKIPTLDISSTDIRNRIKTKGSIKYLLPENVEKYILSNRLYEN